MKFEKGQRVFYTETGYNRFGSAISGEYIITGECRYPTDKKQYVKARIVKQVTYDEAMKKNLYYLKDDTVRSLSHMEWTLVPEYVEPMFTHIARKVAEKERKKNEVSSRR